MGRHTIAFRSLLAWANAYNECGTHRVRCGDEQGGLDSRYQIRSTPEQDTGHFTWAGRPPAGGPGWR